MQGLRRAVFVLMIPLHLILVVWVVFARALFGLTVGWGAVGLVLISPFVLIALGATTVLAIVRRLPPEQGGVSTPTAWAHVALWVSLFVAGLGMADVTDVEDAQADISIVDKMLGHTADDTSVGWPIFGFALLAILASWICCLIAVLAQPRRRRFDA